MRSSFTATTGLRLEKTPSRLQQLRRRGLAALAGMAGLAAASGALGLIVGTPAQTDQGAAFSYFPTE